LYLESEKQHILFKVIVAIVEDSLYNIHLHATSYTTISIVYSSV